MVERKDLVHTDVKMESSPLSFENVHHAGPVLLGDNGNVSAMTAAVDIIKLLALPARLRRASV